MMSPDPPLPRFTAPFPLAVATLVSVEGSSYRRPGARLWIGQRGERDGLISGGCLEDDLVEQARRLVAAGQPRTLLYDTTAENDLFGSTGLGCQGAVRVLVEPFGLSEAVFRFASDHLAARRAVVLACVWEASDHAPLGTLGAWSATGFATAERLPPDWQIPLAAAAVSALAGGETSRRFTEASHGPRVFFSVVTPPPSLLLVGAGDDAPPVAHLARTLGWHVSVIDARAAYATRERFPEADVVRVARPEEAETFPTEPGACAVLMTHRYLHDLAWLRALLPRPLAYLGLLGPRSRSERLLADLESEGIASGDELRSRLHAPVGLDLGGDTPAEIGLSILAEIRAALSRRDARPLRERRAPIHGDSRGL